MNSRTDCYLDIVFHDAQGHTLATQEEVPHFHLFLVTSVRAQPKTVTHLPTVRPGGAVHHNMAGHLPSFSAHQPVTSPTICLSVLPMYLILPLRPFDADWDIETERPFTTEILKLWTSG